MSDIAEPVSESPAEPSTPKGLAMRERLLRAAATVFSRKGYELTRIEDIGKAARTSYGNFYRHFRNKDEALIAVLRPMLDEVYAASRRRARLTSRRSEAEFVEITIDYMKVYARHRKLLRVMREAAARGEQASFFALWMAERSRFTQRATAWLTRLKAAHELDADIDPETAADALGAMTEQMAYVKIGLAKDDPSEAELKRIGSHCARIWYRGVFGVEK
jgi:AcrR family transcriptional regulator